MESIVPGQNQIDKNTLEGTYNDAQKGQDASEIAKLRGFLKLGNRG